MRYINYNGNIYHEHETLLTVGNRGFKYGDSFFESIAMFNRKMPLLDYHWSRATFTAEVLNAIWPSRLTVEAFEHMVLDLAAVNESAQNARIRLQFFRKGGGYYLPEEDELGYVITMDGLDSPVFECGEGIIAGVRDDCYKPVSMSSDLKSNNALNYVLAAQYARAEGWDDIILLNHYSQVCEAGYSNVVVVKDGKLITPDLDSGCVNGVMRTYLIGNLEEGMEERPVELDELLNADEVLLTNAIRGVRWVKAIGSKVYTNKKAVELTAFLNKNLLQTA